MVFGSLQIKEDVGGNEEVKVIKEIEQNVVEPTTGGPAQPQNGLLIISPVYFYILKNMMRFMGEGKNVFTQNSPDLGKTYFFIVWQLAIGNLP